MPHKTKHVAILQGHPDPKGGHFCHALAEAYSKGAAEAGHEVDLVDIAKLDFPWLRSREEQEGSPPEAIREAQAVLTRSDHLVLIYPVWNGTVPARLKGFLEQAFRPMFLFPDFKPGERLGFSPYYTQRKALRGKTARIIATMQMPAFLYRWYFRPHTEKSTLRLAGIGPIRESFIGLVETLNRRRREQWLCQMYALATKGSRGSPFGKLACE
jgi:putative NADPH-quinone reductase